MNPLLRALALPVVVALLAAGCSGSSEPTETPSSETASPAGSPPPVAPAAPSVPFPGSSAAALAPGAAAPQPAVPVKAVPAVLPAVLATVNGERVERWELETALKQAEASAGGPVPPEQRDAVLRGLLDELITYHMLAQEARERKMGVTDAELDTEMAAIRQNFPTEETFQQALLLQGVTADQLRQVTRLGMHARKVIDAEVTSKVTIEDAAVDAFYNENLDRFKQGDSIRVSHIYIALPPNMPETQKNQARAAAQNVLSQLRAGADFAQLAREHSDDASAANGGELGFFEKGVLPADFDAVAWTLTPGQTSDVKELGTGLHIIKVHELRGPRTAPLAEVRENLKQFLLDTQRQTKLDEFIGQLKGRTKIEIHV
jgi:parvulin-like peptidyl-prolyl isomerase